jgi:hypothetical protein
MLSTVADALTPDGLVRFYELVARLRRHRENLPPDVFARALLEFSTNGGEFSPLLAVALVEALDADADEPTTCRADDGAIRDGVARFVDVVADSGLDRRLLRSAGLRFERTLARRFRREFRFDAGRRSGARRRERGGRGRRRARAPCRSTDDHELDGSTRLAATRRRSS